MIFGLKNIEFNLKFLFNDDEETPIKMIGQKMVPILQKEDNSFMPESMDIVDYIDKTYLPQLIKNKGKQNIALYEWITEAGYFISRLAMPRWPQVNFKEFATQSSKNYFIKKKEAYMGSFQEHLDNTNSYIQSIEPLLLVLEKILHSREYASKDELTEDDIVLFPKLRSLSIVKNVNYPKKVIEYMQNMSKKSKVNLNLDIAI
jgi:glutaredoxin 2